MKKTFLILSLCFVFLFQGISQLIDNGDGTLTDCESNLMWLKDARALGSTSLTFTEAVAYIDNLNATNYLGHNDWRLPMGTAPDSDPSGHSDDGQYYYDCSSSEFGNLFYHVLNGCAGWNLNTICVGYSTEPNNDPDLDKIDNLPVNPPFPVNALIYWTGITNGTDEVWTFSFQNGSYKAQSTSSTYRLCAWAVRDQSAECLENQAVVILHDLSGSMQLAHDGSGATDPKQQKIYHAKEAAKYFVDLLNIHSGNQIKVGLAEFPLHPYSSSNGCFANTLLDLTLLNSSNYTTIKNQIESMNAQGITPLMAGITTASNMFTTDIGNKQILLLSDGYHNCPGIITSGDPSLISYINNTLVDNDITLSAVGFARESDLPTSILNDLTSLTGGTYEPVTGPEFDPADPDVWVPGNGLKNAYKDILINKLGLGAITDPMVTLASGAPLTFPVNLCNADYKVSFYASWDGSGTDKVMISLKSSDGNSVPQNDIRLVKGETYTIASVTDSALFREGKVTSTPWEMTIETNPHMQLKQVKCMYGVLTSSGLKLNVGQNKKTYNTGENIVLTLSLKENNIKKTDLESVMAMVSPPEESFGNWIHTNFDTSMSNMNTIKQDGLEPATPLKQVIDHITNVKGVAFPIRKHTYNLRFFDDGTSGDKEAGDGIYTTVYSNTQKAGTYRFYIKIKGITNRGIVFTRETKISSTVKVDVASNKIGVIIGKPVLIDKVNNSYKINITPMDKYGNYLGPGYAKIIKVSSNYGMVSKINDILDGSYGTALVLNSSIKPSKVNISVIVGVTATSKHLVYPIFSCKYILIICLVVIIILLIILVKRKN